MEKVKKLAIDDKLLDLSEYVSKDDISDLVNKALAKYCPYNVGDLLITADEVDPSVTYPDTEWEQVKGRYIVAAGNNEASGNEAFNVTAGATGGEAKHALTVGELANHNHTAPNNKMFSLRPNATYLEADKHSKFSGSGYYTPLSKVTGWNQSRTTDSTGSGTAHNNLPPYQAFYVWKRVN